jgi:hypothetical protein
MGTPSSAIQGRWQPDAPYGTDCKLTIGAQLNMLPRTIFLPAENEIGNTIDLTSPNPAERSFLRSAFESGLEPVKLASLTRHSIVRMVAGAEHRLNSRLDEILPPAIGLRFDLELSSNDKSLNVCLRGYPGKAFLRKLLRSQEVRPKHRHPDMPRCVSPTPLT